MSVRDEHNRIDVSIGGVSYHLTADENEGYMRDIAFRADKAMKKISEANPSLSDMQTSILLIINLMDNLTKLRSDLDRISSEKDALIKENENREKELFIQRDANFELKKELIRFNELNKELSLKLAGNIEAAEDEEEPEIFSDEQTVPEEDPDVFSGEPEPPEEEPYSDPYQTTLDDYFSNN